MELNCPHCDKPCNGTRGLSSHERRCPYKPDLIARKLSKDTDIALKVLSESNHTPDTKLSLKFVIHSYGWSYNDAMLALEKFIILRQNCSNPVHSRANLKLTYLEYCLKMIEANILPFKIGRDGDGCYQLGRISDQGDYTVDNCKFITQQQNRSEQVCVGAKGNHTDPEVRRQAAIKGWRGRKLFQNNL